MEQPTHSNGSPGLHPKLLRRCTAVVLLSSALIVAAYCAAMWPRELHVASEPPGATIWLDGAFAGSAPTTVSGLHPGQHLVVMTKHGFERWRELVSVKARRSAVHAMLRPALQSSLAITTIPPGATVLLDGTARGSTPLTIDHIEPGDHRLRLVKRGFVPHEEALVVEPSQPATVHRTLDSRVERYYMQRLEKRPDCLYDIIELGHHYVLENEIDKAEKTFKRAVHAARGASSMADSERRLYTELGNIHSAQFDYGTYEVQRRAQAMVIRVLNAIIHAHVDNPYAHYHLARMLAQEGRQTDAASHFRLARSHTRDWRFRRRIEKELRKLGR